MFVHRIVTAALITCIIIELLWQSEKSKPSALLKLAGSSITICICCNAVGTLS
jgi:hypothetical protein